MQIYQGQVNPAGLGSDTKHNPWWEKPNNTWTLSQLRGEAHTVLCGSRTDQSARTTGSAAL